jgi:hypothetical protein
MTTSMEHEGLVEIFRSNPRLVPQLLHEAFGVRLPAWERVTIVEAALDQIAAIEFRADLVVELAAAVGPPQLSAIVEIQLRKDDDKPFTWPVYMVVDRSRRRCETILVVIAPNPEVAAWARRPIRIGPDNELRVHVIGPAEIPIVTDLEVAAANPQLALLSALAHGNEPEVGLPVVKAAIMALKKVDKPDGPLYLHLIHRALEGPMRRALKEDPMLSDRYPNIRIEDLDLPDFAANLFKRGKAEGEAKTLLQILDHRGVALTATQRATIADCQDPRRVEAWVDRAFVVATADELLADG